MRSVFLLLLVVNLVSLGVIGWLKHSSKKEVVSSAVVEQVAVGGEPLVLLSEVGEDQLKVFSGDSALVSYGQKSADRIRFQNERENAPESVNAGMGDTGIVTSFDGPDSAAWLMGDEPELQLGDEGGGDKEIAGQALDESSDAQSSRLNPLCTYVGPFKQLLRAEYFVERLASLDVMSRVQAVEVPAEPSFWVYQEPQVSRKAALRRLHELQGKGVDSYVIPKGELENGISFGLYSRKKGAEDRLREIQKLGYEVKLLTVERTLEEVWVALTPEEAAKIDQKLWFELLNREDGLEARQNFCSAVASE